MALPEPSIDTTRWRSFLVGEQAVPKYRDWPQALLAARELHRWLAQTDGTTLTPYMLASEARRLTEQILPSLYQAGVPLRDPSAAEGEAYWPAFTEFVTDVLAELASPQPS